MAAASLIDSIDLAVREAEQADATRNGAPDPWFGVALAAEGRDAAATQSVIPLTAWARRKASAWSVLSWLRAAVAVADIIVAAGLIMVGRGCYLVQPALGWIVPGAILLWYALPTRPRFMDAAPPTVIYQEPTMAARPGLRDALSSGAKR